MGGKMALFAYVHRHSYGCSLVHRYLGLFGMLITRNRVLIRCNRCVDVFLYSFLVPIMPYMLETRLQIDVSLTQRYIFALLALSAGITFVISGPIGFLADKTGSKKAWLLAALVLALISTSAIAFATTSKAPPFFLFFFFLCTTMVIMVLLTPNRLTASHRICSLRRTCRAGLRQRPHLGGWILDHRRQCEFGASGEKLRHHIHGYMYRYFRWPNAGWNAAPAGWLLGGLDECFGCHHHRYHPSFVDVG